jgi:hypothetical protein
MAAIVNARDALLQAAGTRFTVPSLLGTLDYASITGATKPADNATKNIVTYSAVAPANPVNGDIWVDTSVTPNVQKLRVAGAWQIGANLTTNTSHLTDGANLGGTAAWSGVSGAGKPADYATKNSVTYSAAPPPFPTDGDIWVDTLVTPNVQRVRVSGAWQVGANLTTNTNQLTDGANLGGTAAWSGVSGAGKPADDATKNSVTYSASAPPSPTDGDIWVDTSVTPNVTRVRVAGAWQVGSNLTTNTNQLVDGANLGGTAAWAGVSGTAGAVDTVHLAGNAVTVIAAATGPSYSITDAPGDAVSVNVAAPTGTPILITISGIGVCQFNGASSGFYIYYEIVRDGAGVAAWSGFSHDIMDEFSSAVASIPLAATVIVAAPDSSSHTYALRVQYNGTPGGTGPVIFLASPAITAMAVKR